MIQIFVLGDRFDFRDTQGVDLLEKLTATLDSNSFGRQLLGALAERQVRF